MLVFLQTSKNTDTVSFVMSVEPKNKGFLFVVFDCAIMAATDQTRLRIGFSMLNELGKAYRLRSIPQTGAEGLEGVKEVWQAMLAEPGENENK